MVNTIKFSQMTAGGDIANNNQFPGLLSGNNVLFDIPWTFLPPGTTAQRPTPSAAINYRLRFNTDDQLYEYYDAVLGQWTQIQESLFTAGPFVTYTASASLPDAQNLGALADGILKQTISTGVATLGIAVNGTDYYGPGFTGYFQSPNGVKDSFGNIIVDWETSGASAAYYLTITSANAVVNAGPTLSASGVDPNIPLILIGKGANGVAIIGASGGNIPVSFSNGTTYQHQTLFSFADTPNIRTATWQDSNGTVAWLSDVMGTVTSATGTVNQVLVNGTSGTPQTGDITLSTPQDINTSSSPTFANLILGGASQIRGANGLPVLTIVSQTSAVNSISASNQITGSNPSFTAFGSDTNVGMTFIAQAAGVFVFETTASTAFQFRTGTALQHITNFIFPNTAATQNVTWQDASGTVAYLSDVAGTVTSLTGTANQILVNATSGSPQTGALTLTLPSTLVAPGTVQAGNILLNTNSISATNTNGNLSVSANGTGELLLQNNTLVNIPGITNSVSINTTTSGALFLSRFVNTGGSSGTVMLKSRGATVNTNGAVQNADLLGVNYYYGDDGTSFNNLAAAITVSVSGSVSTGIVPTQMVFSTMNTSGVLNTAMYLTNDQRMVLQNPLGLAYGGLGLAASPANGQIPIGNGGTSFTLATITAGTGISITNGAGSITIAANAAALVTSITGTANQVLVNGTSGSAQFGAITLTLPQSIATGSSPTFAGLTLSSPLSVANGGTGRNTNTAYSLIASGTTSTGACQNLGTGTANTILMSGGSAALPNWSSATYPSAVTANQIMYGNGTNTFGLITSNSNVVSALGQATLGGTNQAMITGVDGTFTPAITFGGASVGVTYTTQSGVYSRVGNTCVFSLTVQLSSKGSSTGTANITGLPFAARSSVNFTAFSIVPGFSWSGGVAVAFVSGSSAVLGLQTYSTAGAATNMNDTNFTNTSIVIISGTYLI